MTPQRNASVRTLPGRNNHSISHSEPPIGRVLADIRLRLAVAMAVVAVALARMVHWIAEEAIFFGQAIIRIAYGWRAWAERRGHLTTPRKRKP